MTPAGPTRSAWRRLGADPTVWAAAAVLALVLLSCAAAPLYARFVSGSDPFAANPSGTVRLDGQSVPVMQPSTTGLGLGVTPIGPTWRAAYFLGADGQGRDLAARLLYGGRISLLIAASATLLCLALATVTGMLAGFAGGLTDAVIGRLLDILWAFPIFLLAISLSIVLISHGISIGPLTLDASSLLLPIVIIGIVYVPYAARPIRAEVRTLRRSEFVLAAVALGIPRRRILSRDILPHVATTLIVFTPLMLALNILTESALSFLSIGVQPPTASWGTIIQDGQTLIYTRPLVAIAPGVAIVATVLALNLLGEALRDALDPRGLIRLRAG